MLRTSITFVLLLIASSSFAQDQAKINWLTWDQALVEWQKDMKVWQDEPDAKKKVPPKKFFIDIYTGWCGWCKRMDATTFLDPSVVSIMNQNFYPVKLDAEQAAPIVWDGHTFTNPKPGTKRSTHQFAASLLNNQLSYPSYVMLDENAKRVAIYKGYQQVNDLLGILLFFGTNKHIPYRDMIIQSVKQAP